MSWIESLVLPLCALTIGTLLAAQGPITTPAGYLNKEGDGWQGVYPFGFCLEFGMSPDQHIQHVDGEIKARGPRVLTSVGFRPDFRPYAFRGGGRTWGNVKLTLADGDLATMGRWFSRNQLSPPVVVFSGSVTWPRLSGFQSATPPAPWLAAFRFPFAGPFAYSGNKDLCLDWELTGGTLANSNPWTWPQPYYLDGIHTRVAVSFGAQSVQHQTRGRCSDLGLVPQSLNNAYTIAWVSMYGKTFKFQDPNLTRLWAGNAVMQVTGGGTAPASLVVQYITLNGGTPGVDIGARCNNLMVDLNAPGFFVYDTAAPQAWNGGTRKNQFIVLGNLSGLAPLGKTNLWSQAAWLDSVTGGLALTSAFESTLDFTVKLNTTEPKKSAIVALPGIPRADLNPWYSPRLIPLTRYN